MDVGGRRIEHVSDLVNIDYSRAEESLRSMGLSTLEISVFFGYNSNNTYWKARKIALPISVSCLFKISFKTGVKKEYFLGEIAVAKKIKPNSFSIPNDFIYTL